MAAQSNQDAAEPRGDAEGGSMAQVKALTFDVFGTVVDWRSSIEAALTAALTGKVDSPAFPSLPEALQARARELAGPLARTKTGSGSDTTTTTPSAAATWAAEFASQWRASYGEFTWSFVPGTTPWKDVDAHHLDSLVDLLAQWRLGPGLFTEGELLALSRRWHFLTPWADSPPGIRELRRLGYAAASLSNGNRSLLRDLDRHGSLGFGAAIGPGAEGLDETEEPLLFSAEDFRAYKPSPRTYLGAADALGLRPGQVAMVAAHLGDLEAARACGLRTVYVEREGEEEWKPGEESYEDARRWVDIWIPLREGRKGDGEVGFVELARRLAAGQK